MTLIDYRLTLSTLILHLLVIQFFMFYSSYHELYLKYNKSEENLKKQMSFFNDSVFYEKSIHFFLIPIMFVNLLVSILGVHLNINFFDNIYYISNLIFVIYLMAHIVYCHYTLKDMLTCNNTFNKKQYAWNFYLIELVSYKQGKQYHYTKHTKDFSSIFELFFYPENKTYIRKRMIFLDFIKKKYEILDQKDILNLENTIQKSKNVSTLIYYKGEFIVEFDEDIKNYELEYEILNNNPHKNPAQAILNKILIEN